MSNYWEVIERQWQSVHGELLQPLLSLAAESHEIVAEVATNSTLSDLPPSPQLFAERLLLRRIGEELRGVELLAGTGHGFQAATACSTLFETVQYLGAVMADETLGQKILEWTTTERTFISVKGAIRKSAELYGWSTEQIDEEHKIYGFFCMFKHSNPLAYRSLKLPHDPDVYLGALSLATAIWHTLTVVGYLSLRRLPAEDAITIIERVNSATDTAKGLMPAIDQTALEQDATTSEEINPP